MMMLRSAEKLKQLKKQCTPRQVAKAVGRHPLLKALFQPLVVLDPFDTGFEDVEPASIYEATHKTAPAEAPRELVVMTWNIKFGGGRIDFWYDGFGDRVLMTAGEVISNLEGLATKIRQVNPDVLLLQEVDIDSKRSAHIDQVQWLLDHTELNFGAYASQWKATYIPSNGLGRMNSGNAILSRWKISRARRIALPLMAEHDPITRYFYLKRNILIASVAIPDFGALEVLNIHTSAFARDDTKRQQLDIFKAKLDELDATGDLFVAGGDLNAVCSGTVQLHGFADATNVEEDYIGDDYRKEVGWLDPLYQTYEPAIPHQDYARDNAPYFTHTTDKAGFWNRALDHLFTNGEFVAGSGLVHQSVAQGGMETMPLSDHAPVTARLKLER